jgi:hypothetical protein
MAFVGSTSGMPETTGELGLAACGCHLLDHGRGGRKPRRVPQHLKMHEATCDLTNARVQAVPSCQLQADLQEQAWEPASRPRSGPAAKGKSPMIQQARLQAYGHPEHWASAGSLARAATEPPLGSLPAHASCRC